MTNDRNRWDDEYDAHQEDQNRSLSIDPMDDSQWYQDARYDL